MDDRKHFNQKVWEHLDYQISTNTLTVSNYFSADQYGASALKLQFNITNRKSQMRPMNFSLSHQQATCFLARFRPINKNIVEIKQKVMNGEIKSFQVNDHRKLVATLLNRPEYGGVCTRIAIGEKQSDIQDTEVVFMDFMDFMSLIKILQDYRDTYLQLSNSVISTLIIDSLNDKVDKLSEKITNYYIRSQASAEPMIRSGNSTRPVDVYNPLLDEQSSSSSGKDLTEIVVEPEEDVVIPTETKEPLIDNDEVGVDITTGGEVGKVSIDQVMEEVANPETAAVYNDLSEYIEKERDNIDLGLEKDVNKATNREKASIIQNKFTELFIENDIIKLEMYLTNCLNDPNPVAKFKELVHKKTGGTYSDIPNEQLSSSEYVMSSYLRYIMKRHLEGKFEIPASIPPVIYQNVTPSPDDLSVMYDLYMFMMYYSQLKGQLREKDRNTTNNKELICLLIKTIASPMLFSYITNVNKDVFVSEVLDRYYQYQKLGIFKKLESQTFETYAIKPGVDAGIMKTEIIRVYEAISKNIDKFTIEEMFLRCKQKNIISVDYDTFKKNDFTQEQTLKIIILDLNFLRNKTIDLKEIERTFGLKDFGDIPVPLTELFGITEKKFDNTNLIRYFKETFKDDPKLDSYLGICGLIGDSYYNLKGTDADITILPEEALKAIWLWDVENDRKIAINYKYYTERIKDSSLDASMILSLLNNLGERENSDFTQSLQAATGTGA